MAGNDDFSKRLDSIRQELAEPAEAAPLKKEETAPSRDVEAVQDSLANISKKISKLGKSVHEIRAEMKGEDSRIRTEMQSASRSVDKRIGEMQRLVKGVREAAGDEDRHEELKARVSELAEKSGRLEARLRRMAKDRTVFDRKLASELAKTSEELKNALETTKRELSSTDLKSKRAVKRWAERTSEVEAKLSELSLFTKKVAAAEARKDLALKASLSETSRKLDKRVAELRQLLKKVGDAAADKDAQGEINASVNALVDKAEQLEAQLRYIEEDETLFDKKMREDFAAASREFAETLAKIRKDFKTADRKTFREVQKAAEKSAAQLEKKMSGLSGFMKSVAEGAGRKDVQDELRKNLSLLQGEVEAVEGQLDYIEEDEALFDKEIAEKTGISIEKLRQDTSKIKGELRRLGAREDREDMKLESAVSRLEREDRKAIAELRRSLGRGIRELEKRIRDVESSDMQAADALEKELSSAVNRLRAESNRIKEELGDFMKDEGAVDREIERRLKKEAGTRRTELAALKQKLDELVEEGQEFNQQLQSRLGEAVNALRAEDDSLKNRVGSLAGVQEELKNSLNNITEKAQAIDERLTGLAQEEGEFDQRIKEKLSSAEERFQHAIAEFVGKKEELEQKVNSVMSTHEDVRQGLNQLVERSESVEERLARLTEDEGEFDQRIKEKLDQKAGELHERITRIRNLEEEGALKDMKTKFDKALERAKAVDERIGWLAEEGGLVDKRIEKNIGSVISELHHDKKELDRKLDEVSVRLNTIESGNMQPELRRQLKELAKKAESMEARVGWLAEDGGIIDKRVDTKLSHIAKEREKERRELDHRLAELSVRIGGVEDKDIQQELKKQLGELGETVKTLDGRLSWLAQEEGLVDEKIKKKLSSTIAELHRDRKALEARIDSVASELGGFIKDRGAVDLKVQNDIGRAVAELHQDKESLDNQLAEITARIRAIESSDSQEELSSRLSALETRLAESNRRLFSKLVQTTRPLKESVTKMRDEMEMLKEAEAEHTPEAVEEAVSSVLAERSAALERSADNLANRVAVVEEALSDIKEHALLVGEPGGEKRDAMLARLPELEDRIAKALIAAEGVEKVVEKRVEDKLAEIESESRSMREVQSQINMLVKNKLQQLETAAAKAGKQESEDLQALRKSVEQLVDENATLKKELAKLRSMKISELKDAYNDLPVIVQ